MLSANMYGVIASISTLFSDAYPFLTQTDIGLCFLAIGGGMAIGSVFGGKVLDKDYRRTKSSLEEKARNDPESKIRPEDVTREENFPVEYARLRIVPLSFAAYIAASIAYGWCLDKRVNIAGPLVFQIISKSFYPCLEQDVLICAIVGFNVVIIFNTIQTLLVDLLPAQSSSVAACVCPFARSCHTTDTKSLSRIISSDAPLVRPVYPLSTSYFKLLAWVGRMFFLADCASLSLPSYSSSFALDLSGEKNVEQNRLLFGDPCHEIFQRGLSL